MSNEFEQPPAGGEARQSMKTEDERKAEPKVEPLFTHLPKHEPLTDEQIAQCIVEARVNGPFARAGTTSFRIARAVERAHGIGGSNE